MSEPGVPLEDLQALAAQLEPMAGDLAGRRLFLTGGTGFFGTWLLETIAWLNPSLAAPMAVTVLTRDPAGLAATSPHLAANPAFTFIPGDIRDFAFPSGDFDYVIHGATTNARETFNNQDALTKFDTVAGGTRHLLEFARQCRPRAVLYLGSGACYGRQPENLLQIPESYPGAPDPAAPNSALGIGKRTAEFYCRYWADAHDMDIRIARCFTFFGPHLPLDIHYAIGNFLADALGGRDIKVTGDGTPVRSYLYIADLVAWLFTLLLRGERNGIYNVGSDEPVSIAELAATIAGQFDVGFHVAGSAKKGAEANRYVPDISRARGLGLSPTVSLAEGLSRYATHVQEWPAYYRFS